MMKKQGALTMSILGFKAIVSFNVSWFWLGVAIYGFGIDVHLPFTLIFISKDKEKQ